MPATPPRPKAPAQAIRSAGRAAAPAIPVFALYGEDGERPNVDFVHVELIRSRSEVRSWEIGLHRHDALFQTVCVLSGEVTATLDGQRRTIAAPAAITVPAGVVHAFQFAAGTHGYVLTLAASLPQHLPDPRARALITALEDAALVIELAQDEKRVSSLLRHIEAETRQNLPGQSVLCEWLAASLLVVLARRDALTRRAEANNSLRAPLFDAFRALVEAHYREHWPVKRYAEALRVTESRLDRLCRAVANASAFQVVRDRLLIEARRLLVHAPASVATIAFDLGFEDQAYFCRFFRKGAGLTPSAYRREGRARLS